MHWNCRFRGRRSTLSEHLQLQGSRQAQHCSTLCTGAADFMAGAPLREPRSADCVAGAALGEPRSADCVAGTALGEPLSVSADFVAGAAIANLEVHAWRAQIFCGSQDHRYILLSSPIHCTHITDHHAPLGTVLPLRPKSNSCTQTYKHTGHSPFYLWLCVCHCVLVIVCVALCPP